MSNVGGDLRGGFVFLQSGGDIKNSNGGRIEATANAAAMREILGYSDEVLDEDTPNALQIIAGNDIVNLDGSILANGMKLSAGRNVYNAGNIKASLEGSLSISAGNSIVNTTTDAIIQGGEISLFAKGDIINSAWGRSFGG